MERYWDKLEFREKAAAVALAIGVTILGAIEVGDFIEHRIEEIMEVDE
ncbi:hypothetical protein KC950_04360 [Candidatus Saccharibacteria bacterium]|nr:hypothetical protein [Candidatus Saccharibacteria bacterium]